MKLSLVIGGIIFFLTSFFTKNESINTLISKSISEYKQENYYTAALFFDTLNQQYQLNSEPLYWNLANSWLKASETDSALLYFEKLSRSQASPMRSRAFNQIGLIQYFNGFPDEAESAFIESLKNDNTNVLAKYNLELLQKIKQGSDSISEGSSRVKTLNQKKIAQNKRLKESKAYAANQTGNEKRQLNQTKKPKAGLNNKEPENKNIENLDQNGDNDKSTMKSRKNNSTIEQQEALRILEIMKQNEIQYLQQIKRKSKQGQNIDLPQY